MAYEDIGVSGYRKDPTTGEKVFYGEKHGKPKITVRQYDVEKTTLDELVEAMPKALIIKLVNAQLVTTVRNGQAGSGVSKFDKALAARDYIAQNEPDLYDRYKEQYSGKMMSDMLVEYYDTHELAETTE